MAVLTVRVAERSSGASSCLFYAFLVGGWNSAAGRILVAPSALQQAWVG